MAVSTVCISSDKVIKMEHKEEYDGRENYTLTGRTMMWNGKTRAVTMPVFAGVTRVHPDVTHWVVKPLDCLHLPVLKLNDPRKRWLLSDSNRTKEGPRDVFPYASTQSISFLTERGLAPCWPREKMQVQGFKLWKRKFTWAPNKVKETKKKKHEKFRAQTAKLLTSHFGKS